MVLEVTQHMLENQKIEFVVKHTLASINALGPPDLLYNRHGEYT